MLVQLLGLVALSQSPTPLPQLRVAGLAHGGELLQIKTYRSPQDTRGKNSDSSDLGVVALPDYNAGVRTTSPLVKILPDGQIQLSPSASGTFFVFSQSKQAAITAFFATPFSPSETTTSAGRKGSHIPELSVPTVAYGLSFNVPFNDTTNYQNRYAVCVDSSYDPLSSVSVLPSTSGFPGPVGLGYGNGVQVNGTFAISNNLIGKNLKVLIYAQINVNADYILLGFSDPSAPVTASPTPPTPVPTPP